MDLLIVGVLQGTLSYPFFDPVLTDRCFLSSPKTMARAFTVGGLAAGWCVRLRVARASAPRVCDRRAPCGGGPHAAAVRVARHRGQILMRRVQTLSSRPPAGSSCSSRSSAFTARCSAPASTRTRCAADRIAETVPRTPKQRVTCLSSLRIPEYGERTPKERVQNQAPPPRFTAIHSALASIAPHLHLRKPSGEPWCDAASSVSYPSPPSGDPIAGSCTIKSGCPPAVAAALGEGWYNVISVIMITSSISTLDSTFTSCAKLVGPDIAGYLSVGGKPLAIADATDRHVTIGRIAMVLVALIGTVMLFENPSELSATTVSGTVVMGIGIPIIAIALLPDAWLWKRGTTRPLAFLVPFFVCVFLGICYQLDTTKDPKTGGKMYRQQADDLIFEMLAVGNGSCVARRSIFFLVWLDKGWVALLLLLLASFRRPAASR